TVATRVERRFDGDVWNTSALRYCLCRNRSFLTQKPGFRNSPIRKGGRATLLYHNTVPYSMSPFTDLRTGSDTFLSMGHDFGYARVSTGDQDARLQHDALTAAGCYRIFTDTASGSLESRPELDKLLDHLRPGDTLVVWRLDRLGRSIRHLIDQLSELQARVSSFDPCKRTSTPRRLAADWHSISSLPWRNLNATSSRNWGVPKMLDRLLIIRQDQYHGNITTSQVQCAVQS